ncbi:MAG: CHAP domain-containing protein [Solirubrobacterales bacterium]
MSKTRNQNSHFSPFAALLALLVVAFISPTSARALTLPPPDFKPPDISGIVELAESQLKKRVSENRSNNVPRYRNGKGRIAPFSIGDQWCAAFATWVWQRNGFVAYQGARLLRRSHDGTSVAVQVKDLTQWAQRNGYFSYAAMPGFLVAYGTNHIGIVSSVNRKGRALLSIEGNKSDKVSAVTIEMKDVTGYISPFRIFPSLAVSRSSPRADVD